MMLTLACEVIPASLRLDSSESEVTSWVRRPYFATT